MYTEQERQAIRRSMTINDHDVYIISMEEMDAIIRSSSRANKNRVQQDWNDLRPRLESSASYYSSSGDAVKLTRLIADLGAVGARAYIKHYGGKPHIILKGHPGLRTILTGTKYGIKNPKVISMGLGKSGAVTAAKQGGILTVVLLSAYRVVDYFLSDQATLTRLIGTLGTDIAKIGITAGASIAAATFVAGFTTLAVGPLVAVVVVGFGLTLLLDKIDRHFQMTERLIAALEEVGDDVESYFSNKRRDFEESIARSVGRVIEQAVGSARETSIRWVKQSIKQYLAPVPGLRR